MEPCIVDRVRKYTAAYAQSRRKDITLVGMTPDDFVQDFFLILLTRDIFSKIDTDRNFEKYLSKLCYRHLKDLLRKHFAQKNLDDYGFPVAFFLASQMDTPLPDIPSGITYFDYTYQVLLDRLPDTSITQKSKTFPDITWQELFRCFIEFDRTELLDILNIPLSGYYTLRKHLLHALT